jgi:hypothetical protein
MSSKASKSSPRTFSRKSFVRFLIKVLGPITVILAVANSALDVISKLKQF